MKRLFLGIAFCLLAGAPAAAQYQTLPAAKASPVPYVPNFLGAMSLSMHQQEFYGSYLLQGFHSHLAQIMPMQEPQKMAEYLKAEIEGSGRDYMPMGKQAKVLGQSPVEAKKASAILLANALASPNSFQDVVTGLEGLKPGLGNKVSEILREAPKSSTGGNYTFLGALRQLGERIRPKMQPLLYNAKGEIEAFFDGR